MKRRVPQDISPNRAKLILDLLIEMLIDIDAHLEEDESMTTLERGLLERCTDLEDTDESQAKEAD